MELRDLGYLRAVAANGHLGRTADSLKLTQPALTKCMARLERELGVKLLGPFHHFGLRSHIQGSNADRVRGHADGPDDPVGIVALFDDRLERAGDLVRVVLEEDGALDDLALTTNGVLLEEMRPGFGNEGRDPDGGLEASGLDLFQHRSNVAAEGRACLQPVAHRRLVSVVNLDVFVAEWRQRFRHHRSRLRGSNGCDLGHLIVRDRTRAGLSAGGLQCRLRR